MYQLMNYADLGYRSGITDYKTKIDMNVLFMNCLKDISNNNTASAQQSTCTPLFSKLLLGINKLSPFDSRELYSDITYLDPIRFYMDRTDVKIVLAINASSQYRNCDNLTYTNFLPEFFKKIPDQFLPNMLKNNYRVLLYNAQFDLRVDTFGTSEYLRYMEWEGRSVFNSMKQTLFKDTTSVYGQFKSHLGLSHMVIYGAGHIAARSAPKQTLSMVNRFIGPTQNLCDIYSPNCLDLAYTCPGNCTSHGLCLSKFTCQCLPGYSGNDCSVGQFPIVVHTPRTFSGTVFGKDINIFQLEIRGADSLLDANISLTRTSNIGTPYIYLSIFGKNLLPTPDQVRALVYQKVFDDSFGVVSDYGFLYVNNTIDPNKKIIVTNLQLIRGSQNYLTIVIFNSDDVVTDYQFDITIEAGSGLFELTAVLTTLVIFLCLVVIFQAFLIIAGCQVVSEAKETLSPRNQRRESQLIERLINENEFK